MMNLLGFGTRLVDISFNLKDPNEDKRKTKSVKIDDEIKCLPIFHDREDVNGMVSITLRKPNSKIDHHGIRIEFVGQVETNEERSTSHEFVALSKLLAYPGELSSNISLDFAFVDAEKPFESFYGNNVKLRYILRLTIIKRFTNIVAEEDVFVEGPSSVTYDSKSEKVSMEVGIEDSLHIEFEYLKSNFHLNDVIIGKIYFALVRIKIKHMELNLARKENIGIYGGNSSSNEIVAKYEILDGAPTKGETVPIRFFLSPYDLSPTMKNILNKFSVTYSVNLILVDEEDRRYFKQQDIVLWRKAESEFLSPKEHIEKTENSNEL